MPRKPKIPTESKEPLLTPQQLGKSTKTFLDLFKTYWGYFMTVVAAVTFVWTLGVKSEKNNIEKTNLVENVQNLSEEVNNLKTLESYQSRNIDSLINIMYEIKRSQQDVINSQNSLRNSYVRYLTNDRSLTKKDFLEYMEGIEFQLQQDVKNSSPKLDTSEYKPNIVVKKIDKSNSGTVLK